MSRSVSSPVLSAVVTHHSDVVDELVARVGHGGRGSRSRGVEVTWGRGHVGSRSRAEVKGVVASGAFASFLFFGEISEFRNGA